MQDIFFQEKSRLVLLSLAKGRRKCISEIATEVKGSYAHIYNLIKTMEEGGILSAKKEGRTKYVTLTEKGRRLAEALEDFEAVLKTGGKPRVVKSPALEKLERYQDSLEALLMDVKRKPQRKHPRLLGRYRSLVRRVRPRTKEGKKLKADVNALISSIEALLEG
jgi:predicted transcriptional regulator